MASVADIGSPVFQPPRFPLPGGSTVGLPRKPDYDENKIAEIAGYAISSKVDAAIARLDVSSCCRCCGIDWRDEIVGLSSDSVPPSDRLQGLRRAVAGDLVFKSGIRSFRTTGAVLDANYADVDVDFHGVMHHFTGQIAIVSEDNLLPFSMRGDSGSAVVGDDGFIVGLLFAGDGEWGQQGISLANHISDVCTALGITINLDRSATDTAGAGMAPPRMRPTDTDVEIYAAARERLLEHPAGQWLWALAGAHREEVVELVTRHRPVTVAWHRAGGPALFATALKTLRAGSDWLPVHPDGSSLDLALTRIADALRKHGSSELRDALDVHASDMLAAVRDSTTFADVLDRFRRRAPDAGHTMQVSARGES
jgi:hypothetical protein